ncbi:non-ribosomal peptide synthetase [uncultured Salinisphaera sp.]|uniref:non-ribosomal peptide synthetase n=1 Tax=uncultured Salinisphaera sp. TaxID=359372 RepID=UPI0032B1C12D
MTRYQTLTGMLDAASQTAGEIGFIDGANDERRLSYRLLQRAAHRMLAVLQAEGAAAGEPLVIFVPDTLRFLQFFWAGLYGGLVPVPVAAGATNAHLDKLVRVWRHMGEPRLVMDAKHLARVRTFLEDAGEPETAEHLAARVISDEPSAVETEARPANVSGQDTAFIQFSSGSTGDPKGVVLTHANVLANVDAISAGSDLGEHEIALSWMPLTHDMGLIGFHLTLVYSAFTHYLMTPDLFARRPLLWLEKASEKGATLLCSPNFGYRHTLRAISARGLPADLDLSAVRLIYNGAEPISAGLAREFLTTLAPCGLSESVMFCVYGMAEASLAASFPPAGRGLASISVAPGRLGVGDTIEPSTAANAIELVDLGQPVQGAAVRIVDANEAALAADRVGHVWIRGANVTAGYYDNPEANAAAQRGDGWLATGDLGFVHDGNLFITGRAKDIIFVGGANFYPQDIEAVAAGAPQIELGKIAAAGVRTPGAEADALILFVVFRGHDEDFVPIARNVAQYVNQQTGLVVDRVVPIERMPKTTSGKLQRAELASAFVAGDYSDRLGALEALMVTGETPTAADSTADEASAATLLAGICHEVAPDKQIGPDDNLFEVGLSSLELAQIHEGIEAQWPDRLEVTDLFDYPTINDLAEVLDGSSASS